MKELIKTLRELDATDAMFSTVNRAMRKAADALERLTSGDVELPEPLYTNKHRAYEDSFSKDQLIDYGNRRAAQAMLADRERIKGEQA